MKLSYPLKQVKILQGFGSNPTYYARFLDAHGNPEKGHMGIDMEASHGTPVYAAHDGFACYVGPDAHGGDGIYLRFEDEDNKGHWWTTIYWHLCPAEDPQFPTTVKAVGRNVKQGELLGYADNTGAPFESSGDHLHFGLAPCGEGGNFLLSDNGYGGCVDAAPYFPALPNPIFDTIKAEVQVLQQTKDPSVYKALLDLIIKQIRAFLGI